METNIFQVAGPCIWRSEEACQEYTNKNSLTTLIRRRKFVTGWRREGVIEVAVVWWRGIASHSAISLEMADDGLARRRASHLSFDLCLGHPPAFCLDV